MAPYPLVAHPHSLTEHAGVVGVVGAGVGAGSEGLPLQDHDNAITIATPSWTRSRRRVLTSTSILVTIRQDMPRRDRARC
jgi:hypothetical protein